MFDTKKLKAEIVTYHNYINEWNEERKRVYKSKLDESNLFEDVEIATLLNERDIILNEKQLAFLKTLKVNIEDLREPLDKDTLGFPAYQKPYFSVQYKAIFNLCLDAVVDEALLELKKTKN